jgi:hypothetical protein
MAVRLSALRTHRTLLPRNIISNRMFVFDQLILRARVQAVA